MRAAAAEAGLTLRGTATHVDARLLAEADLVLAMDRTNLRDLHTLAADSGVETPIVLFRTFDPTLADEGPSNALVRITGPDRDYAPDEVPDPYQGGPDDFVAVVELCRRTAQALVADLEGSLGLARSRSALGRSRGATVAEGGAT